MSFLVIVPERVLKMLRFAYIFHDFPSGKGNAGNPESLEMPEIPYIFMIRLMEKEAWETQNH